MLGMVVAAAPSLKYLFSASVNPSTRAIIMSVVTVSAPSLVAGQDTLAGARFC